MFLGKEKKKLDGKGRLIFSRTWRELLGDDVVCIQHEDYLEVISFKNWVKYYGFDYSIKQKAKDLPKLVDKYRKIYSLSERKKIDSTGRLNINSFFPNEKEVVLIGFCYSIEIRNIKQYEEWETRTEPINNVIFLIPKNE